MNFFTDNIIVKGGWVMVPIILGSIVAVALVIERGMVFRKIRLDVQKFIDEIFFLAGKNEMVRAMEICSGTAHPIGPVLKAGLMHMDEDMDEIERVMEREGNRQIALLEKNLGFLMVVVGVEPMLGFLGTIIGLIRAFMAWEKAAATVTVDQLAAGIYQAMITTAGGLIVAIPFYIIYNYFTSRVNTITRELNHNGDELLSVLNKSKRAAR